MSNQTVIIIIITITLCSPMPQPAPPPLPRERFTANLQLKFFVHILEYCIMYINKFGRTEMT